MKAFNCVLAGFGLMVGGYSTDSAQAAILGPNLVTNGDFESGDPTLFWALTGDAAILQSGDTGDGSNWSMSVTNNGETATSSFAHASLPLESGKNYQVSLDFKHESANIYFGIYASIGTVYANVFSTTAGTWDSVTFETGEIGGTDVTSASFRFYPFSVGGIILLDNISVQEIVVPEPGIAGAALGMLSIGLLSRRRQR